MFVEDLAKLGTDAGIAVRGGANGNIFFSSNAKIPSGPGPYTSFIPTGGLLPLRVHNRKTVPSYERPGAQIVVRATDFLVAMAKAEQWYALIFSARNKFINNIWYQDIACQQEPFDGGVDEQARVKVIFNVIATKRPS